MRFIIFNGPPGAGKTTAARYLAAWLPKALPSDKLVITDSFAAPLKHFAATLFAAKYQEMAKDMPVAELSGDSVRQLLIKLSEEFMKPEYGNDIFGRMLYYRSLRHGYRKPDFVIVDDSGFDHEYEALGEGNAILVRITRDGKDFINDSRGYLNRAPDYVVDNDGTEGALEVQMQELAHMIVRDYAL